MRMSREEKNRRQRECMRRLRATRSTAKQLNRESWTTFLKRRSEYAPPDCDEIRAHYRSVVAPPGTRQPRWMNYVWRPAHATD